MTHWIMADPHFGHRGALKFRDFETLEDMHDTIICRAALAGIKPNDKLIIAGDVCFNNWSLECLRKLPGRVYLILGNHDNRRTQQYIDHGVSKIFGALEYKDCIITHIPVHESQLQRYRLNIHGHLHNQSIDDPRYKCVSMEQINYTPVRLDDLL